MQEFKLPDLGEGMHEAEIRRWLVKSGDTVKLDQPMVEVETDKAVVEIPAPVSATIADIRVQEGTVAKLGEVLITFASTTPPASSSIATTEVAVHVEPQSSQFATSSTPQPRRVQASPAVRKRAFELGVDLERVPSSQPHGRVTVEDLHRYVERAKNGVNAAIKDSQPVQSNIDTTHSMTMHSLTQVEPQEAMLEAAQNVILSPNVQPGRDKSGPYREMERREPLTGLRRRIAEHMEHAWRTIPHATSFDEIDASELALLRAMLKPIADKRGIRLTYMPLLVKLLLPALKEFPVFNAHFDEATREIVYKQVYHVGIATDTPEGLLVPVLRDADKLTVTQIAQQLEHLIMGAQNRSLTLQEVAGSTFTLNNIGSFGGNTGTPIINAPEVAILAVGRIQEKAIVHNGNVIVRTMMPLAMSFDHRVIDGVMAGRFLSRFKELVEQPQQLILDML